jgi:hypothetical protein
MYQVCPGVRVTQNQDGGVVLDIDHGKMFRLNCVGSLIIGAVEKGHAAAEIAKQIAESFHISNDAALADVHEFLKTLERCHLVCARMTGGAS